MCTGWTAICAATLSCTPLAINWIIDNQLGRRNLTPEQQSFLRGKRCNREKKSEGRPLAKLPQNEGETAERLAAQYGVSRATIERDSQFAEAVDTLAENVGEGVKQKMLAGDSTVTKEAVIIFAWEAPALLT